MKKEDINKKLRVLKDPTDRIKYLSRIAKKASLLSPETRQAVYKSLGDAYFEKVQNPDPSWIYPRGTGNALVGNPGERNPDPRAIFREQALKGAEEFYRMAGDKEKLILLAKKYAPKIKGAEILESMGNKEGALDLYADFISSKDTSNFPKNFGRYEMDLALDKLMKGGRETAVKDFFMRSSQKAKEAAECKYHGETPSQELNQLSEKGSSTRGKYAKAIKFARKAGDKETAKQISKDYKTRLTQIKKEVEKELERKSIEAAKKPKKSLLSRIIGSILFLFSIGFIFMSFKGFTGYVISNSGYPSGFSIVFVIIALVAGLLLLSNK